MGHKTGVHFIFGKHLLRCRLYMPLSPVGGNYSLLFTLAMRSLCLRFICTSHTRSKPNDSSVGLQTLIPTRTAVENRRRIACLPHKNKLGKLRPQITQTAPVLGRCILNETALDCVRRFKHPLAPGPTGISNVHNI